MDLIEHIKQLNGYTTKNKHCRDCKHFEPDDSTDNFGPGDACARNPDVKFRVSREANCNKWSASAKPTN